MQAAICSGVQVFVWARSWLEKLAVKNTNVEVYKAHSYSIEPAPGDASKDGIYSLDGEVIEYGPIQGNMLPHAARVLKL